MLLVGHEYVRNEGALTGEERYRDFNGLAVPVLAAFKSVKGSYESRREYICSPSISCS